MNERSPLPASPPSTPAPAAGGGASSVSPPLDAVMLAMDVVDTLRHQRALVDAELDEEGRERALVERVQSIYATQGIEVPADVVRQGVEALRADRFVYVPPGRSLAVRLAELYVDRRVWALRALAVLVVVGGTWGWFAWKARAHRAELVAGFASRMALVQRDARSLDLELKLADRELEKARAQPAQGAVAGLLEDAAGSLAAARASSAEASAPLAADGYPDAPAVHEQGLASRAAAVRVARDAASRAVGQLGAVARLRSAKADWARLVAPLAGFALGAGEQEELDGRRASFDAALDAGDAEAAKTQLAGVGFLVSTVVARSTARRELGTALSALETRVRALALEGETKAEADRLLAAIGVAVDGDPAAGSAPLASLRALVAELELEYDLRVVSQEGERSGVWRHPDGHPERKTFYVIVDAVRADGARLPIPVQSEEDGRTAIAARFGVRVPEAVFEKVKADKLDNGVVDDALVGRKRRGVRAVEYRFEVLGGRITRW